VQGGLMQQTGGENMHVENNTKMISDGHWFATNYIDCNHCKVMFQLYATSTYPCQPDA